MMKKLFFILIFLLLNISSFAFEKIDLVKSFGEFGKGEGNLSKPAYLILDEKQNLIYITDEENNKVNIFNKDGKFIKSFGNSGKEGGQFNKPQGIAFFSDKIYVADSLNNRVQIFDKDGKFLGEFGKKGNEEGEFNKPVGLDIGIDGLIYVADSLNNRVQIFNEDGIFLRSFGKRGKEEGNFNEPLDIKLDLKGNVYVLDSGNSRLQKFDRLGNFIKSVGTKGKNFTEFNEPEGICIDEYGFIYVSDTGQGKVKEISPSYDFKGSFGTSGQFKKLKGIFIFRNEIFLVDRDNAKIHIFSLENKEKINQLRKECLKIIIKFNNFVPLNLTNIILNEKKNIIGINKKEGIIYIVDENGETIKKIGSKGKGQGEFNNPSAIALDSKENIFVVDTGNKRIQKFDKEGNFILTFGKGGSKEGEFNNPVAIALNNKGKVYILDKGNNRVQIFNEDGLFLSSFGKRGNEPSQFKEVISLSVDGNDNIYIIDKNAIKKFNSDGNFLKNYNIESKEAKNIFISKEGEIFVNEEEKIHILDLDGNYILTLGKKGNGKGEFKKIENIFSKDNKLYISDSGNARIQVFNIKRIPSIPSNLKATGGIKEVKLEWNQNQEIYLSGYKIYRSNNEKGEFKEVGKSSLNNFTDTELSNNTTYYYKITATSLDGGESPESDLVSATTLRLICKIPSNIKADAGEKEIRLNWDKNTEDFFDCYKIYRSDTKDGEYKEIATSKEEKFVDKNLKDETTYYYKISALAKEGEESEKSDIISATTLKPFYALEISELKIDKIFSANYKFYTDNPIGKIILKNTTDRNFSNVKISVNVKGFMDCPTENNIKEITVSETKEIPLMATFNNKILDLTEDSDVQVEIKIYYLDYGEEKEISRIENMKIYSRNALVWDKTERIATFITPKDPYLLEFSRGIIQQYTEENSSIPLAQNFLLAREIFAGFGVYGISYLPDPNNPYEKASKDGTIVDYVQYPRETLKRKTGDCDDCVNLFCSALENISINTCLLDAPGHIFMMFDTGYLEEEKELFGFSEDSFVIYEGGLWIPVEATMFGTSFTNAWEQGAKEYKEYTKDGKLKIVDVHKAWEEFKPATLLETTEKAEVPAKDKIENKFNKEIVNLVSKRFNNLTEKYKKALELNSQDINALEELGIVYTEFAKYDEAMDIFNKILQIDINNAYAYNNLGNIYYLKEDLDKAKICYEAAIKLDPFDAGIFVNLARVYYEKGDLVKAKEKFSEAVSLDPNVENEYSELSSKIMLK